MAFTNDEMIKLAGNVLAAGVLDSNTSNWYSKTTPNKFIIDPTSIWDQLTEVQTLPADNFTEAVANAVANPTLIGLIGINDDGSYNDTTAIRMSPIAGTNNRTYAAYIDYGDANSGTLTSWMMPQLIPRSNGAPSAAYSPIIFSGLPSAGNKVLTSTGNDGNWVSHFWNAAGGLLLICEDDAPPSTSFPSDDIYICGFTYEGSTGGGSFSGDTLMLESDSGDSWRIRVEEDGTYMNMERYETLSDGSQEWVSHGNFGSSIETGSVILTDPYSILFDKGNTLNSDNKPEYVNALNLDRDHEDLILGDSNVQLKVATSGDSILRQKTLVGELENEFATLKDVEVILNNTNPSMSWLYTPTYEDSGDISHQQINKIALSVSSVSDEVNGVPMRLSIHSSGGVLLLENVTIGSLNKGAKNNIIFNVGDLFYDINPTLVLAYGETYTLGITVQRDQEVTVACGSYEYVDSNGDAQKQKVPWQYGVYDDLMYSSVFDCSNYKDRIVAHSNTLIDNGISSVITDPVEGWSQGPWSLMGVGQHVDTRNPYIGNFYDKTYINAGSGGIWSLVEVADSETYMWSEFDRLRITDDEEPDDYVETTTFSVDLYGIFDSEMNDAELDVVNLYKIMPFIEYVDEDHIDGEPKTQRCRVEIDVKVGSAFTLFESQSEFDFLDGKETSDNFTYNIVESETGASYYPIQIPNRSFTVNHKTNRTLTITFEKPVRVYGYYPDPEDPLNPQPEEFMPSFKGDVIFMQEEQILYGDTLEAKLNGIVGSAEWVEASEMNYSTLHEEPSLEWLSDWDEEPLLFLDTESQYSEQDEHQYLYTTGREAIYSPILNSTESEATAVEMVVHLPNSTNINSFYVTLKTDDISGNISTVNYTFYVNSGGDANSIKEEVTVAVGNSIIYTFSKDRNGQYRFRTTTYTGSDEASKNVDNVLSENIPVDPNV